MSTKHSHTISDYYKLHAIQAAQLHTTHAPTTLKVPKIPPVKQNKNNFKQWNHGTNEAIHRKTA
jgi:hypothetical protein